MRNRLLPKIVVSAWSLAMIAMGGGLSIQFLAPDLAQAADPGADCASCHEKAVTSFKSSYHGKAWKGANGCQACHGQTSQHLTADQSKKSIFSFAKDGGQSAEEMSNKCLSCHSGSKHVALWESSKHKSAGLSCNSCHTGHSNLPKNLKMPQTELCFSCHRDIKAESGKQSHHPIKEGKISCSDCHSPHGSFGDKAMKADSVNELCYKCHAEKRGPFLHEHPPVAENCLTCHNSHGSNHNKLVNQKTPNLCQSCHVGTSGHFGAPFTRAKSFDANPTVSGTYTSQRAVGRACLNCHAAIHGSNGPGRWGKQLAK